MGRQILRWLAEQATESQKEAPAKIVEEIVKTIDDISKQKRLAEEAIKTAKTLSWSSAASQMEIALEGIVSGRRGNRILRRFK